MERNRHKHCGYCGCYFETEKFPKYCYQCKETTWRNPLPVVVVLVPIESGVLLIRRGENPDKGELALPGGYLDYGEAWRVGSVRELQEETQISVSPDSITLENVISSQSDSLLVFGRTPVQTKSVLDKFTPNSEVTELVVVYEPIKLVWSSHTEVLHNYFTNRSRT